MKNGGRDQNPDMTSFESVCFSLHSKLIFYTCSISFASFVGEVGYLVKLPFSYFTVFVSLLFVRYVDLIHLNIKIVFF